MSQDMQSVMRLPRRRVVLGTISAAGFAWLPGCSDEEDEGLSAEEEEARVRTFLRGLQRALSNAAHALGAAGDVDFFFREGLASSEDRLNTLLSDAGIDSGHRNRDIIAELYELGISATYSYHLEGARRLQRRAEPVLETAYYRALGECERNMPSCDIDITTRFRPPGSPGGRPSWMIAWWDFSSP